MIGPNEKRYWEKLAGRRQPSSDPDPHRLRLGVEVHTTVNVEASGTSTLSTRRPVCMTPEQRDRGLYIIGLPGKGKTTLIQNAIVQDLAAGHGLAFISPEEETFTEQILPLIPKKRIDDVVYVNPLDTERPVPLNPLHLHPGERVDRNVQDFVTVFRRIAGESTDSAAPRMMYILRHAIRTLIEIPKSNLFDVEDLLDRDNPDFRNWAVQQLADDRLRYFWTKRYPSLAKESAHSVWPRIEPFLQECVGSMLCTRGESLDFYDLMKSGKVLLFSLPDELGEDTQAILGQFIVAKFQLATLRRRIGERRPFFIYIDEFQTFCNAGVASYEKMLTRARKRRAPLILAHQFTTQIPEPVLHGIFGTVSTAVAFAVGDTDARRLAREMHITTINDQYDAGRLRFLDRNQSYCRMDKHLHAMTTDPPPRGGSRDVANEVIERSRANYGVPASARSPHPGRTPTATTPRETLPFDNPGDVFA
jgi:hypothetical protein